MKIVSSNTDRREPADGMGSPTRDLLSQIVHSIPGMSRAERCVADLVRSDPDFAVHAHTRDIAGRAGVSTATVSRFCRTVGCRGLHDLKLRLAKVLAVGDRYLHPPMNLIEVSETVSEIVSTVRNALDVLVEQVDGATLKQVATTIAAAQRVLVFGGGGGSSMAAMEAENRLFRFGLRVTHCNDAQLQLMMAATLSTRDALVVLSITGNYAPIIQAAEIARQYGARTIAVTDPESPLSAAADQVVPFHVPEPQNILVSTPARYMLLALIDMLSYEVAELRGEPAIESMRRIKYQLVQSRDADDSKPLGD